MVNPVERLALEVEIIGDQLSITPLRPLPQEDGEGAAPQQGAMGVGLGTSKSISAIYSGQYALIVHLEDFKSEMLSAFNDHKRYMQAMNTNIRRIAVQPAFRILGRGGGTGGGTQATFMHTSEETAVPIPKLAKYVRDLFTLWKEYEHGLNGEKPARDYSAYERGKNKYVYCHRKVFWDVIDVLIKRGFSAETAIDRIYVGYGRNKCVSVILRLMASDRKAKIIRF